MTWSRSSGTAGDIVGTWTFSDSRTGNTYTITFNANGTMSLAGNIVSCGDPDPNQEAWTQHWPGGYSVSLQYRDAPKTASAVSVTGPGITSPKTLTYDAGRGSWNSWTSPSTHVFLGTSSPAGLPYTYTFSITEAAGTRTATAMVSCFQEKFATNLSPTGSVTGTPTFSWTGIGDSIARYQVQLNDSNYNRIWSSFNVSGTSVPYNGPALTSGATYRYHVVIESSSTCGSGASFAEGAFTYGSSGGDTTAPTVPTGVSAVAVGSNRVNVSWNISTDNVGVTYYQVYRNGLLVGTSAGQISNFWSDNGVVPSTTYSYTVAACDAAGNCSSRSAAASATTPAGGADTTAPTVPTGVSAVAVGSNQVNVSWNISTDNVGVTYYQVYRNGSLAGTPAGPTNNFWPDNSVVPGTTYSYTVAACDAAGNCSSRSAAASATTQAGGADTTAPTVPTGVSAVAVGSNQVNVSWNISTDNVGVTYYQVYRNGSLAGTPAGPTNNFWPDNSVVPGTTYSYTVAACDAAGNCSSQSAAASATTPAGSAQLPLSRRGGIDIDGNGKSAIVLRSASAQLQAGRLVNNQFQFSTLQDPGSNYRLVGIGDFFRSGKSDLAFQNMTQGMFGDIKVWRGFSPTNEVFWRQVKQVWDVQASGDLDGDGFGDLVWRYVVTESPDTGVSYIWFTNGSAVTQVRKRGGAPLNWTLLGAADLNGDGAADMVYINPSNQARALMATENRTCANVLIGSIPTNQTALKLADFTGNGRGDILVRDSSTGAVSLLRLNAASLTLPPYTGAPDDPNASCSSSPLQINTTLLSLIATDPAWQFYASGDFNGDGIVDIVWKRPDGTLTLWLMNPNSATPTVIANAGLSPAGVVPVQP